MTIALGMLAHDGIVIAADTQVGITDYLKARQGKIYFASELSGTERTAALAVTGAGNAQYLKHLQQDLINPFTADSRRRGPTPSVEQFHEFSVAHIKQFYSDHVLPFASYGANRPDVWLLIGYYQGGACKLWSSEDNLLTESGTYATVGIGAMYANILLSHLFLPMWPLDSNIAVLLAAFVIHQVKEVVDGCGKDTDT